MTNQQDANDLLRRIIKQRKLPLYLSRDIFIDVCRYIAPRINYGQR